MVAMRFSWASMTRLAVFGIGTVLGFTVDQKHF